MGATGTEKLYGNFLLLLHALEQDQVLAAPTMVEREVGSRQLEQARLGSAQDQSQPILFGGTKQPAEAGLVQEFEKILNPVRMEQTNGRNVQGFLQDFRDPGKSLVGFRGVLRGEGSVEGGNILDATVNGKGTTVEHLGHEERLQQTAGGSTGQHAVDLPLVLVGEVIEGAEISPYLAAGRINHDRGQVGDTLAAQALTMGSSEVFKHHLDLEVQRGSQVLLRRRPG